MFNVEIGNLCNDVIRQIQDGGGEIQMLSFWVLVWGGGAYSVAACSLDYSSTSVGITFYTKLGHIWESTLEKED